MARTRPFDEHPEEYDAWFTKNHYVYRSELAALKVLTPHRGRSIEIGIGSGRFASPLGITWGIDPSAAMLRLACRRRLRVARGIAERLPVRSGSFELALMTTTICYVDDLTKSFREIQRILVGGGLLVLGFVDGSSPLGKKYRARKNESVFYREATFHSAEDVFFHLGSTGFGVVDVLQTVFGELSDVDTVQKPGNGHGEGGFVAVQARKLRGDFP